VSSKPGGYDATGGYSDQAEQLIIRASRSNRVADAVFQNRVWKVRRRGKSLASTARIRNIPSYCPPNVLCSVATETWGQLKGTVGPEEIRLSRAPGCADDAPTTGAAQNSGPAHLHTEGGTTMSSAGTSVFTETCGQVRPLKFSRTV